MTKWYRIDEGVSPGPGTSVLAAFKGQFRWTIFTAVVRADGSISAGGYAPPTHWRIMVDPPEEL